MEYLEKVCICLLHGQGSLKVIHCSIGRTEPVGFVIKNDQTGLGKSNQDSRMIETTVAQRRFLDSERMRKETEEQRKARQVC